MKDISDLDFVEMAKEFSTLLNGTQSILIERNIGPQLGALIQYEHQQMILWATGDKTVILPPWKYLDVAAKALDKPYYGEWNCIEKFNKKDRGE